MKKEMENEMLKARNARLLYDLELMKSQQEEYLRKNIDRIPCWMSLPTPPEGENK